MDVSDRSQVESHLTPTEANTVFVKNLDQNHMHFNAVMSTVTHGRVQRPDVGVCSFPAAQPSCPAPQHAPTGCSDAGKRTVVAAAG